MWDNFSAVLVLPHFFLAEKHSRYYYQNTCYCYDNPDKIGELSGPSFSVQVTIIYCFCHMMVLNVFAVVKVGYRS